MGMLDEIVERLVGNKMFCRERKKNRTRALGIALYYLGVSLRDKAEVVSSIEKVSHEAVRQWFQRLGTMKPAITKKERKIVAIDETKLRIRKKWYFLWAAIDVDTKELIGLYLSSTRTSLDTMYFLNYIMRYCENKPVILQRGKSYICKNVYAFSLNINRL
jgi:putative transposase